MKEATVPEGFHYRCGDPRGFPFRPPATARLHQSPASGTRRGMRWSLSVSRWGTCRYPSRRPDFGRVEGPAQGRALFSFNQPDLPGQSAVCPDPPADCSSGLSDHGGGVGRWINPASSATEISDERAPAGGANAFRTGDLAPYRRAAIVVFADYSLVQVKDKQGHVVESRFARMNPVQEQILSLLELPSPAGIFARRAPC